MSRDLQELPRVIVVVEGGCVSGIYSEIELNCEILDHDNNEAEGVDESPLEEEAGDLDYCY